MDEKKLIDELKQGSKDAANVLIERYFSRVYKAAENRLKHRNAKGTEADDIAMSVFESLWRRASDKRFEESDLSSSDELWRLLSKMIQFKTDDHARRATAVKRGAGQVQGESVFGKDNSESPGISGHPDDAITPIEAMELREGYLNLMEQLDDETLQQIAVLRLENQKVGEIAESFKKSERWVKRKLALIREIWSSVAEGSP